MVNIKLQRIFVILYFMMVIKDSTDLVKKQNYRTGRVIRHTTLKTGV